LSRAGRPDDLYCLETWSRVIITARQCSRRGRDTTALPELPEWPGRLR